jgi:hypothetical protein
MAAPTPGSTTQAPPGPPPDGPDGPGPGGPGDGSGPGGPAGRPRRLAPQPPRQAGVDRFDDAIVVTRTRAWIGLAACLLLVVGIIVWSTTTTVDTTIKTPGIALVNGTISGVISPAPGIITRLTVSADTPVHAGEVIGRVAVAGPSSKMALLVAPITGRVLSLDFSVGSIVHAGEPVANLSAVRGPLLVRMFISPVQAEEASVGQKATLTLPTGTTVTGRVTHVGQLPLTGPEVADAIGSQALAGLVAHGASFVAVNMRPGRGSAKLLTSGDVGSVTVVVGSQHPIDYVF